MSVTWLQWEPRQEASSERWAAYFARLAEGILDEEGHEAKARRAARCRPAPAQEAALTPGTASCRQGCCAGRATAQDLPGVSRGRGAPVARRAHVVRGQGQGVCDAGQSSPRL